MKILQTQSFHADVYEQLLTAIIEEKKEDI